MTSASELTRPGWEHLAAPADDETLVHLATCPFCTTQQVAQGTANINVPALSVTELFDAGAAIEDVHFERLPEPPAHVAGSSSSATSGNHSSSTNR